MLGKYAKMVKWFEPFEPWFDSWRGRSNSLLFLFSTFIFFQTGHRKSN